MAVFMVLSVCTINVKAETVLVSGTDNQEESEAILRNAISNAGSGDTIELSNTFALTSPIVISKDLILDFKTYGLVAMDRYDGNNEYGEPIMTRSEGAIIVDGCKVTIKGERYSSYISAEGCTGKAVVIVKNGGEVTFDGDVSCSGLLVTYDDSDNNKIIIKGGEYTNYNSTSEEYEEVFDINKGTVEVYKGSFYKAVPDGYITTDNECVYLPYASSYVVRSKIVSGNYQGFLDNVENAEIIVKSTVPTDDQQASVYILESLLAKNTDGDENVSFNVSCVDFDRNVYDIEINGETHRIIVIFDGFVEDEYIEQAEDILDSLPKDTYGESSFSLSDMEVINLWKFGGNPYKMPGFTYMANLVNYSGELKKYTKNVNVDLKCTEAWKGQYGIFFTVAGGPAVLKVDGVSCSTVDCIELTEKHIIYVPSDTNTDANSLLVAAQKRIDEYLGDSSSLTLAYGGSTATMTPPKEFYPDDYPGDANADLQQELAFEVLELGLTEMPEYYYILNINGYNYYLFVIPDSDKMLNPQYKTVDIKSNVTISSDSAEVPLDSSIRAKKLTSGADYEEIIDTLDVDNNITYDLNLYSGSTDKYVKKLEDGEFVVSIPITDDLADEDLAAYYIDADGKIEEYPVEVTNDGFAEFETNHFSIYTIAKASPKLCSVNGKTHKLTAVPAKAATTTAEGNKAYWTCDCGKWFADADAKTEITDKTSVIIPKLKDTTTESNTTTEAGNKEISSGTPDTGDSTNVVLLFGLLLVSTAVIFPKKKEK